MVICIPALIRNQAFDILFLRDFLSYFRETEFLIIRTFTSSFDGVFSDSLKISPDR